MSCPLSISKPFSFDRSWEAHVRNFKGFGGLRWGWLIFVAWQQPKISILMDRRKWMDRPSWDSPYYTLRLLCQMDGKSTAAIHSEIPTSTHNTSTTEKKGSAPWLSFLASILLDQRSIPNCSPGISPHQSCTKILGVPPDSSEETKIWRIWRGLKKPHRQWLYCLHCVFPC